MLMLISVEMDKIFAGECEWDITATMKRTRLCTAATDARAARKKLTCSGGLLIR
jgi:hypothetical protein